MNSSSEEYPQRADRDNIAETEASEPQSKSQRKRDAHQITELASQLVAMKPKVLAALPLEPGIREAIAHCAEIKAHGARKRQLHFVSKLLREADNIDALQSQVLYPDLAKKKQAITNPHLAFRDRLVEDFGAAVEDLQTNYPNIEMQRVRQLVRNAQAELKKAQVAKQETDDDTEHSVTIGSTKAAKTLLKLLTRGN